MTNNRDLELRRTWIFKADVRGHYIPEKPLVIGDFELRAIEDKEKGTKNMALSTVQAKDLDSAVKLAREKFERFFVALTLSTGRGFDFELVNAEEITPKEQIEKREHFGFLTITLPFSEVLKTEKKEQVRQETQEILQLLNKTDLFSEKAIEYFIIGNKLSRWPREAFLPFFKAIELISDKFFPEFEKRIKEKIPDLEPEEIKRLATSRRKILNACEILGIKGVHKKIRRIVTTRNKFDVAHPTLKIEFKKENLDTCRELARKLIVNYLRVHVQNT